MENIEKPEFIPRFIAWFIDFLVLGLITFILAVVVGGAIGLLAQTESSFLSLLAGTLGFLLLAILFLLQFLYFGYFWSKDGQSIGKKVSKIKVVDKHSGQPISFIKAGLRGWFGYWLSAAIFWLGYIWAAFDSDKAAWHDMIFSTAVVKTEKSPF